MSNENIQNVHCLPRSNEKSFKEVLNEHFRLFPEKKPGELAKFVGVAARSVSAWRAGRAEPHPGNLQAIADFFGVHIRVFLPPPGPAKEYTPDEKKEHAENDRYGRFIKYRGLKEEFAVLEGLTVKELDAEFARVKARFGIDALETKLEASEDAKKLALKEPAGGKPDSVSEPEVRSVPKGRATA